MTLAPLWSARSVAIVGASARPGALGRLPVEYLLRFGFPGRILPVNPNADEVMGIACYPSVTAAPGPVDLALVLVGAERVLAAIDDCAVAGVPVTIVGTAGFAEAGNPGLQAELVRRARAGGVRIVGPNCIGAVAAAQRQIVSFSPLFSAPDVPMTTGDIAFVSQSGALGFGAVSLAYERGLGLGWIVNTGNEADVTAVEVLTELAALDECRALLAYAETMRDGTAWRRLAESGKPVAVLKAGTSESGAAAARSHTGALAASDRVVDDVLRQLGIVRARDVEDLLDIGEAFTTARRTEGRRVAVITTSGGSGILAADAIADTHLELATLSQETTAALADVVPAFGSVANPVDVTATVMSDRTLFDRCLRLVAADPNVDAIVACFCVLTGTDADVVVDALANVAREHAKPVVVARTGADFLAPQAAADLRAAGIPTYPTPARAVRALAAIAMPRRVRTGRPAARPEPAPIEVPAGGWTEPRLKELLRQTGLPVPAGRLVRDAADAAAAVRALHGRAVAKAVAPGLVHKTDAGAVELNVTESTAAEVFGRLAAIGEVYVEEMIDGGAEVLIGIASGPLGKVITLASGGVLTEVIDDAVFRLLPIDQREARSMVDQLRGAAVLRGARGREPLDVDALVRMLVQLSDLAAAWPTGYDLDLNPVAVLSKGVCILDAAAVASRDIA